MAPFGTPLRPLEGARTPL